MRPRSYVSHGLHRYHGYTIRRSGDAHGGSPWLVTRPGDVVVLTHAPTLREAKAWVIDQIRPRKRR